MAYTSTLHALLISLVIAVFFRLVVEAADNNGGFGIELIHRDSPLSPFYNPLETSSDRLRKSVRRSMSRFMHLTAASTSPTNLKSNIESQVIPNPEVGEYLMKLSIGTPPVEFFATADTGSDLIWTQCKPCIKCYVQDALLFDPKHSSTYNGDISCHSKSCKFLKTATSCGGINTSHINNCVYAYAYADKSYTIGVLAKDTFTFDSNNGGHQPVAVPKLVFGCGHNNTGIYSRHGSGLVGLGGGPLSLVSQLGSKIDGKFSYCLVPISGNSTSKLNFGRQAIISSNETVSTPLISKDPVTYYYLTLEGISVGDKKIKTKPLNGTIRSQGNIIIDSGSTYTVLDGELYTEFESAVRAAIDVVPTQDTNGTMKLCYDITKLSNIDPPQITFHFTGADLHLNELNTFVGGASEDLVCLAMLPSDDNPGLSTYGNLAQMNFQVEYDLVGRKVSFAPADCTKF